MSAPQVEKQEAPRGLWGGIAKIIDGVRDVKMSLKHLAWAASILFSLLFGGLGVDRYHGLPVTKKLIWPLISSSPKQDPKLEARLVRMEQKQDSNFSMTKTLIEGVADSLESAKKEIKSTKKNLEITQVVVEKIAKMTNTDRKIKEERARDRGLFGIDWP